MHMDKPKNNAPWSATFFNGTERNVSHQYTPEIRINDAQGERVVTVPACAWKEFGQSPDINHERIANAATMTVAPELYQALDALQRDVSLIIEESASASIAGCRPENGAAAIIAASDRLGPRLEAARAVILKMQEVAKQLYLEESTANV
jgi:hypothetical protein